MIAFDLELARARCIGVHLPEGDDEVEALAQGRLEADELRAAEAMRGKRRRSFLGGRLALREALARAGIACGAVLVGPRGAPAWPAGVVGSVSHKDAIAVALVARDDGETRGVDVEALAPRRHDVARLVLTDDEAAEVAAMAEGDRARAVLLRFSAKEAIYKAIDPFVRRYVGFKEVSVWPEEGGSARADVRLRDGAFDVPLEWRVLDGWIVTAARARRVTSPTAPG